MTINYNLKGVAIVITYEVIDFFLLSKRELSNMFSDIGVGIEQLFLGKKDAGLQFVVEESKLSCFQEYRDSASISVLIDSFSKVLGLFPKLNLRAMGTNYDAIIEVGDHDAAKRFQLSLSVKDPELLKKVFGAEPVKAGFQAFFRDGQKDYDIKFEPVQADPKQTLVHFHVHRSASQIPTKDDLSNIIIGELDFLKNSVDKLLRDTNV